MTSIHTEFINIMDHIEKLTCQSYVTKTIGKPPVPVFFVRVLHLMLRSLGVSEKRIHVFCVSTTLLQMGLVTHDRVSLAEQLSPEEMRERQLMVLSGDYYSSLFYHLLSKHQEIEGIHCLAKATSLINEIKMTHRAEQCKGKPLDLQALKRIQSISSGLLTALADFFHVGQESENNWKKIIPGLMLFDELRHCSDSFNPGDTSSSEWIRETWAEMGHALMNIEQQDIKRKLSEMLNTQFLWLSELSLVKES
ncbi:heptaprenyl diphosphate synthase component 1 [Paenactinomyces guangxiensis]|uniref:Heptaprenyl diphosphate synthase component 1 n=1 Tax=Paenactinomyces guangxiensis TaxID=1490290 RepID=A0A7W2A9D1_9BACL|nr:heptaprenyl diphosphate synthase component 1 [Paenactinomyces guangxiensis]MBA4495605.1 heptaprenyl diphosphate synthase component 1 [Paenactinomyces guangxiensis]MBH8592593.1 heptaprenyl diphosphate synthase component 1 [Paenactinomyces guangxiensis]